MSPLLLPERMAGKIEVAADGCWIWTGRRNENGYGRTCWGSGSRVAYVHRVTYHVLVDPTLPVFPGRGRGAHQLDHLCFNPSCCNPSHLEPVSQAENVQRSVARRGWSHGLSGYVYHGCRCDTCRAVYATYRRDRRALTRT